MALSRSIQARLSKGIFIALLPRFMTEFSEYKNNLEALVPLLPEQARERLPKEGQAREAALQEIHNLASATIIMLVGDAMMRATMYQSVQPEVKIESEMWLEEALTISDGRLVFSPETFRRYAIRACKDLKKTGQGEYVDDVASVVAAEYDGVYERYLERSKQNPKLLRVKEVLNGSALYLDRPLDIDDFSSGRYVNFKHIISSLASMYREAVNDWAEDGEGKPAMQPETLSGIIATLEALPTKKMPEARRDIQAILAQKDEVLSALGEIENSLGDVNKTLVFKSMSGELEKFYEQLRATANRETLLRGAGRQSSAPRER